MALSITELKKGTLFELDGVPYKVLNYSQKVMGRGGSIVNVRIKNLHDGRLQDRTFKGNEQLQRAEVTNKPVQYLYSDHMGYHFMDGQTYEQFSVAANVVIDKAGYFKEGDSVTAQIFSGQVINIELPKNVLLKITYTEDAVRGDTSSAITKDATLETGLKIRVPAFIKQNDIISVDTATGAYRERAKN
jgi:elongation factor P